MIEMKNIKSEKVELYLINKAKTLKENQDFLENLSKILLKQYKINLSVFLSKYHNKITQLFIEMEEKNKKLLAMQFNLIFLTSKILTKNNEINYDILKEFVPNRNKKICKTINEIENNVINLLNLQPRGQKPELMGNIFSSAQFVLNFLLNEEVREEIISEYLIENYNMYYEGKINSNEDIKNISINVFNSFKNNNSLQNFTVN